MVVVRFASLSDIDQLEYCLDLRPGSQAFFSFQLFKRWGSVIMPASFHHKFVPHVNFSFRRAMSHAKTRLQNRAIGETCVYVLNNQIVANAEKVDAVFVETLSKVDLILWRQLPFGMSPDLIDHSTEINQAADLIARTTQTHIFHGGAFRLRKMT
jgi:hypothetical protein